jgi:hypothetical protein
VPVVVAVVDEERGAGEWLGVTTADEVESGGSAKSAPCKRKLIAAVEGKDFMIDLFIHSFIHSFMDRFNALGC